MPYKVTYKSGKTGTFSVWPNEWMLPEPIVAREISHRRVEVPEGGR